MPDADHKAGGGRVAITGANGALGRRLIERLLDGEPRAPGVCAVVRSERAADTLRALPDSHRPEIAVVDYRDADGVARAIAGCTRIVHLVGILKETALARYTEAHETVTWALVRAAAAAGCQRIVYLSILGAEPESPNRCLASKGRAERIVLDGPVSGTVLRVPMVLGPGDPASHALRARARSSLAMLVRGGASLEQPIDADDVVAAIVNALPHDDLGGVALDLAGPESLSQRELVERTAALYHRRPRVLSLPLPLVRASARVLERVFANPPLTVPMLEVLQHDDRIDPAPACKRLGVELTPLDATLRRCAGPEPAGG